MNARRRLAMQGGLMLGALAANLIWPLRAMVTWPKAAFGAKALDTAMRDLVGSTDAIASDKITLEAPEIAENGAVVPITVETELAGVESISVFATKNPRPLTCTYLIPQGTLAYVETRIKMGDTADVIAVVKANGKLYSTRKKVKVTIGGCGG